MNNFNKKWTNFLEEAEFDTSNLQIKDELHPDFWRAGHLDEEILQKLQEIAEDAYNSLELDDEMSDLIVTGSISGYNWHKKSDIDLHILLDFTNIDKNYDLVKKFLDSKKTQWNKAHKIMIHGHEVEIYFQDINEEHVSLSVYSLITDEWLVRPIKVDPEIDIKAVEKKAAGVAVEIDHLQELMSDNKYKEAYDYSQKIKEKVKKLRSSGLEGDGVFSVENLAFKLLRNDDYLSTLMSIKTLSYDKMMSVGSSSNQDKQLKVKIMENWLKFSRDGV